MRFFCERGTLPYPGIEVFEDAMASLVERQPNASTIIDCPDDD